MPAGEMKNEEVRMKNGAVVHMLVPDSAAYTDIYVSETYSAELCTNRCAAPARAWGAGGPA
jgi:hypothetical protein